MFDSDSMGKGKGRHLKVLYYKKTCNHVKWQIVRKEKLTATMQKFHLSILNQKSN